MTSTPNSRSSSIRLDHEQTAALARLLRQVEHFLDECDDAIEDELAAPPDSTAGMIDRLNCADDTAPLVPLSCNLGRAQGSVIVASRV